MIGFLGLARETFDVKFAEKFEEGKTLSSITSKIVGIDNLITNDELSSQALKFSQKKMYLK